MLVWFWLLWWTLWNWLVHDFQIWLCIFVPAMIGWETSGHIFIQSGCSKTCCDSLARVFPRLERAARQFSPRYNWLIWLFASIATCGFGSTFSVKNRNRKDFSENLLNFSDIDECYAENDCSANALCDNLHGSYNCTCKEGYYGDGKNCTGKASSVFIFSVPFVRRVSFETITFIKCEWKSTSDFKRTTHPLIWIK